MLHIFDDPGPLRPTDDQSVSIHISWIKDDPYDGLNRLTGLTAAERAQKKANSYGKAGYQNVQIFSRRYLDQDFACVRELDPRFHKPGEQGGAFPVMVTDRSTSFLLPVMEEDKTISNRCSRTLREFAQRPIRRHLPG